MSWKVKLLAILVVAAAAAAPALRRRNRWAQTVNGISRIDELLIPIDAATLLSLRAAIAAGGQTANVSDSKPQFVYATIRLEDGRSILVRPAYTEGLAPEGTIITARLMDFLRAAADDPKAGGIAVNPGAAAPAFSATLEKHQVLRLLESLKRRGFEETPPRRPAAAPETVIPAMSTGTWVVRLDAPPPDKRRALVAAIRGLSGKGPAEAKALLDSAPVVVAQGLSPAEARRWKAELNAAGGMVSISELP